MNTTVYKFFDSNIRGTAPVLTISNIPCELLEQLKDDLRANPHLDIVLKYGLVETGGDYGFYGATGIMCSWPAYAFPDA